MIGVSKYCCPMCTKFLQLLQGTGKQKFGILGLHKTVYPCSLPPWALRWVKEGMVTFAWDQLIISLLETVRNLHSWRPRRHSSGSHTLDDGEEDEMQLMELLRMAYRDPE